MAISKEEVKKIAFLARLDLNDLELAKYQDQLSSILKYVDSLKELDCSDLDFLGLESDNFNQFREDQVENCNSKTLKTSLDQFSNKHEGQLKINRIL